MSYEIDRDNIKEKYGQFDDEQLKNAINIATELAGAQQSKFEALCLAYESAAELADASGDFASASTLRSSAEVLAKVANGWSKLTDAAELVEFDRILRSPVLNARVPELDLVK